MTTQNTCSCSSSTLPEEVRRFAEDRVAQSRARSFLIPTLHKLQNAVGYLRDDHIEEIAELFGVTPNQVKGVASFYHFFSFEPKGACPISVCTGTACHVRGAADVLAKIMKLLKIEDGERTEDGLFSIGGARCVGMCALAPVVIIGEKVYGNVTPDQVEDMLKEHGFKGDET